MDKNIPAFRKKKKTDGRVNNRPPEGLGKATQFKPGQSGNPAGTTKNPFPALIRKATNDGNEIVEVALAVLRQTRSLNARMWAAEFLRDTGWHKPVVGIKGSDDDGNDAPIRIEYVR